MIRPTRDEQRERVAALLDAHFAAHVMALGVEVGLFEAMAGGPLTPEELAARCDLDTRYVENWCRTAYGFGLLETGGDRSFALGPHMDRIVGDANDPFYLGDLAPLRLLEGETCRRHPSLYRSGAVFPEEVEDPRLRSAVAAATRNIPGYLVAAALPRLLPDLAEVLARPARLLDVGCGAGAALVAFARAFPDLNGVGYEPDPISAGLARRAVVEAGLEGRMAVEQAGAERLDAREEFDLATMILVLHHLPHPEKPDVLERVRRALRPGGHLLVVDQPYPARLEDHRRSGPLGVVVTQFYEGIYGNVLETADRQWSLLEGAGFRVHLQEPLQNERFLLTAGRV